MNFASKNPKKKRRIDEKSDSESLPGPSSQVLPLVAPHLVKKSSKDPHRGMYPSSKGLANHQRHLSSPQFVKASELRRQLPPQSIKEETSLSVKAVSDNTNSDAVLQDHSQLDTNSAGNSVITNEFKSAKKLFNSRILKVKRRSKFANIGAANKITKYFRNSNPSKPQTVKSVASATQSSQPDLANESKLKAGFKQKDDNMLETLAEISNHQFFQNYRDCYGLVDNSVPENAGDDYFSILPTHIIENILCQIPILDMMACRLVCNRWCEIIDSQRYMEWKKLYYKLKKCHDPESPARLKLREILCSLDYKTLEDGCSIIVKYMESKFNHVPSSDMSDLLMGNSKGELAAQVLSERFPESKGKETRVWCQFAIAILISETVWDIFDLYKSLFTVKSSCSRADVTNAMYCVATFLLYFRLFEGINSGLHYRLYYALYLIENHIPKFQREKLKIVKGLPGQQSMLNYSKVDCSFLTYEQIRVLNHQFDMNQKIRIVALAGTGKTTTLLHLSKLYPQIKFLNLVFNKSVNDEAKKKFPQNVTCKTAHSLAFSAVGKFLRHKLTSTLRPYDLINHLKHNDEKIQIYAYANLVLSTINNFTHSKSSVMGLNHVPTQDYNRQSISFTHQNSILMDAYKIWQMMLDEDDPFKITHDVYLKLYHLKKPRLNKYQCIMVDEAQDCNPVILDIVLSQTMPVIFVGDPNQQIYGFRGAQNALENISATHTYHLTKSFRFGPEISYIASCILECMLNKTSSTIVGSTNDSYANGKVGGQYAIIARTNVVLFNEALRIIVFKRLKASEPTVINAAFAGGINSYGFDQISDIYRLKNSSKNDKPITDKFISRFKTYSDLVNYARYSDDSDLLSKIEIVNQHGHDISKFIYILKERCNHPMERANVVFTTAHKSKGLEFDTVCLTDDYPVSTVPGFLDGDFPHEESHILYVAITRAKKYLLLPEKITKVLHLAYEKFEYPVSSKSVVQDTAALNCVQCHESFTPHTVLMYMRRKVIMGSEREIEGGPICMKCGSDPNMRPEVHVNGLVMYLDSVHDNAHRFMSKIVGPLPDDPPIIHDRFAEFQNADRVFVINLNIH